MHLLPLTRGMHAVVDDDVYQWASRHKWFAGSGTAGKWYAARTVVHDGKKTTVYLHRMIAGQDGLVVDHRNGDTLDNRRANLRAVTHAVNLCNRRSGRGVTGERNVYRTPEGRFRVQLGPQTGNIHVGTFRTLASASVAAATARLAHFGEV